MDRSIALLLTKARAYAEARGIALSTASMHIFNDGKVLRRLSEGAQLRTRRYNAAMAWLNERIPDGF